MSIKKKFLSLLVLALMLVSLVPVLNASAAPTVAPDGWTEVSSFSDLKTVLTNNTTTRVRFVNDIYGEKNGIKISPQKSELIIDGNGKTFYEYGASSLSHNIRLDSNSKRALNKITLQNMKIAGQNWYGPVAIYEAVKNVTLIYKNVDYVGPQMTWNRRGYVQYYDCNIALVPGYGNTGGEVAEAMDVVLGGNISITKNQPKNADEMFYLMNWCRMKSGVHVLDGANVNVVSNQAQGGLKNTGFLFTHEYDAVFEIGNNATFNYVGNNLFLEHKPLGKMHVGENAEMNITTYGDFYCNYGQIAIKGEMNVYKNATVNMRAIANKSPACPVLQMKDKAVINFRNPKEVFVYNSSVKAGNTGLAVGPWGCVVTVNFWDTKSIDFWNKNNPTDPYNATNPTHRFENADGSRFFASIVMTGCGIKYTYVDGYKHNDFDKYKANLKDVNVLRVNAGSNGYVHVKHVNMEDPNDVLAEYDYEVYPGAYGTNNEYGEEAFADYFYHGLQAGSDPVSGTIADEQHVYITHEYRKQQKFTLTGTYNWDDDSDFRGERPATATVALYLYGQEIARQTVVNTGADSVPFSFDNLDYYEDSTTPLPYTVADPDEYIGYEQTVNGTDITQAWTEYILTVIYHDRTNDVELDRFQYSVAAGRKYEIYPDDYSYLGLDLVDPVPSNPYITAPIKAPMTVTFYYEEP